MNFTREPIIETIISPKEGCKLLVRGSKAGNGAEEYYVDAVEVVSFGHAFFFRSLERPKAFLVPASDYEILEVKETRVALKNVSHERNIKIGGGREASLRQTPKEAPVERDEAEEQQSPAEEGASPEPAISSRMDKRRDRRRRHRRSSDDQEWQERRRQQQQHHMDQQQQQPEGEQKAQGGGAEDEAKVSSSMFSSLIPPPPTLISETISRYKDKEFMERAPSKKVEDDEEEEAREEPSAEDNDDDESKGSESSPLHRVATPTVAESLESGSFTSTHFSPLPPGNDPFQF